MSTDETPVTHKELQDTFLVFYNEIGHILDDAGSPEIQITLLGIRVAIQEVLSVLRAAQN